MAYTAGDLVTSAQKRIKDTNYSSSDMLEHLSDELYDIYNEYPNLFPVQTSTNFTLAANVADITNGAGLPALYSQGATVELTTAGTDAVLPIRTFQWVQQNYPDPSDTTVNPAGIPRYVYYLNNTINVYPVPNTAYTVRVTHYNEPAEVTASADVPQLPKRFREMLVLGMAYRALQIKDNYDQAGVLENKRNEQLLKFVVKTAQPFTGPKLMKVNRRVVAKRYF